jgi:hypothetical protein
VEVQEGGFQGYDDADEYDTALDVDEEGEHVD